MPIRVYRVCRAIHFRLNGIGAMRVGGRWNSPGRPVVYMAESISLAVLENLVHLHKDVFPTGYVVVSAEIPDDVSILTEAEIRKNAQTMPSELGDEWMATLSSAVLKVPSVVVPKEFNYLLNPAHSEFEKIKPAPPEPFQFDERMFE